MPHGCGERDAVRLTRCGEGRTIPADGRRGGAGRLGRVPHPHGGGTGDRHLRERVGGGQPDRPFAAEQRRPKQPAVGVGLAALPLRGGTRRRAAPPVEFALEDLELAVEQVGAAPGDRQAPGQPEPAGAARRHGEPSRAHGVTVPVGPVRSAAAAGLPATGPAVPG